MVEVVEMLVLSTGHLSMRTGEALEKFSQDFLAVDDWCSGLIVDSVDCGWQIYADYDQDLDTSDFPSEILQAIQLARKHGCTWIRYDINGPQVNGLPYEDW